MLIDPGAEQRVYLAVGSTDMRKSIDALAALVQVSFDWTHSPHASLSSVTGSETS
jgi:transposase